MIHKVRNYSATLTTPDNNEGDIEATYRPLVECVCLSQRDVDDLSKKLKIMLRNGVRPLVVAFEPDKTRRFGYDPIE
jgi:hypothetical protein